MSEFLLPCRYKNRSGMPCGMKAVVGAPDQGCLAHSQFEPIVQARRAAQVKGGKNRSNIARAQKIVAAGPYAGLADVLQKAAQEVYDGQLDPQRGHALANLARAIVITADAAVVSERLAELETEIAAIKSGEVVGEVFARRPLVTPGG